MVGAAAVTVACSQDHGSVIVESRMPLSMRELPAIILRETDTLFIGKPSHVVKAASGGYIVVDALTRRAIRFDESGKLDRVIFPDDDNTLKLVALAEDSDSTVILARGVMSEIRVGRLTESRSHRFASMSSRVTALVAADHQVYAGTLSTQHGATLAILNLRDSGIVWLGKLPTPHRTFPNVSEMFWGGPLRVEGDSVMQLTFGSSVFRRYGLTRGSVVDDTISLQGVKFLEDRMSDLPPRSQSAAESILYGIPVPEGIGRTHDGLSFVVWSFARPFRGGLRGSIRVSANARHTADGCLTDSLPVQSVPYPRTTTKGDTVFVLEQMTGNATVQSRIRRFLVTSGRCRRL